MITFQKKLEEAGHWPLRASRLDTLQVNVGKLCNQTCRHCHVDAGPTRREIMTRETAELVIGALNDSYSLFQPGEIPLLGDVAALTTRTVATAFRIGIQLSAPFVVFGLLFNLGLGVLSRLMPQMQVFFVGLPISILLGFLILLLVVGAMMGTFLGSAESVLRELAPHS